MTVHHRFESLADFMCSVANAADHPAAMDDRLRPLVVPGQGYSAAATGSTSSVPSEGGFAVPTEFVDRMWTAAYDSGQLMSLCDPLEMSSETLRVPAIVDTSRADTARFGGMRLAWLGPGDELPATNPKVRAVEFHARRLGGISYATDEVVADAAWEPTLLRLFGLEASHVIEQEIVSGAGEVGPLGLLNSGALITVAAESGQAAATIRAENLVNMYGRLWGAARRRAVWLLGDDAAAQIALASLGTGTAFSKIVSFADGGMQILGRPAYSLEQCSQLGTVGDVILADLSQYAIATRSIRFQSSIHVRFVYGENVFRFTMRCDGQPYWASTITPKNAAATQSPFVTLAAR